MFGLTPSDIKKIIETLQSFPEVEEAFIYGSRAMGNYKPGSDVDIALKGKIDSTILANISVQLNERLPLPYKFDVVNYSTITHKPYLDHIDTYGKSFYKR